MAGSPAAVSDELKYLYASNVNVDNFVSEKLQSDQNYPLWKAQMLCLIESQQMHGIIDNLFDDDQSSTYFKQYDSLLKGWIFGSITPDLLREVVDLKSAGDVWQKLQFIVDGDRRFEEGAYARVVWQKRLTNNDGERELEEGAYAASTSLKGFTEIEPQDPDNQVIQIEIPTVTEEISLDTTLKSKLLKATVEGRWWQAESLLKNDREAATKAITNDGNTMLHVAVARGRNDFVEHLLDFIGDGEQIEKKNSDGRTALHIAAIVGNTRGVELLVARRRELLAIPDDKLLVPLVSAYYNMKHDTFVYLLEAAKVEPPTDQPSGFFPNSAFTSGDSLLITLIFTKQYDLAFHQLSKRGPRNDDQLLMALAKNFPSELRFGEALIYPSLSNVHPKLVKRCSLLFHSYGFLNAIAKDILWAKRESKNTYYRQLFPEIVITIFVPVAMFYPIYQLIRLFILVVFYPFLVLHFLLWKVLATVVMPIKRIDKKKNDYTKAKRFLTLVCDNIDKSESKFSASNNNHPSYSKPILEAACQGSHEVVNEILLRSPKTIGSEFMDGHNIIQLAVINRSEKAYNLICPFIERMDLSIKDSSNNNLLHLAGRLAPSFVLGYTTGAALQLQRELQWFKEMKKFMSPKEIAEKNGDDETPEMVFTKEHDALMNDGEKWLKTTAESCSITAALITTIVFAAAITVPGGNNQEGIPLFKKEVAFIVFAVSDAISLFASSTSLLVFLSILTARFSKRDFLVSLPRRLITGLTTLIISTIAMVVAFCAVLFLVFCEQKRWMLAPIGGLACFPIAVIVTLQFPLVVDLFQSTYRPIFLAECSRSNMKHL